MLEIIIGVFSGVVTTSLIFLIKILFTKWLIPFYEQVMYRGAIIDGEWFTSAKEKFEINGVMGETITTVYLNIKQKAHKISGNLQLNGLRDGLENRLIYTIEGNYIDGYANFTCLCVNRNISSVGVMLLKNKSIGSRLEGSISFREGFNDSILNLQIELARINSH
ncbi:MULTISPECIES: hypothetical protein [Yersinia]|uniref:hypothetical protein n=1 Tax=Yersinia TaxID=629 RepID=UPI0005E947EE|nr:MULTISPECIES: hypothetical protein [Yersinia]CNF49412.1 Uncharacterised protein [Yersinia mollaretii]